MKAEATLYVCGVLTMLLTSSGVSGSMEQVAFCSLLSAQCSMFCSNCCDPAQHQSVSGFQRTSVLHSTCNTGYHAYLGTRLAVGNAVVGDDTLFVQQSFVVMRSSLMSCLLLLSRSLKNHRPRRQRLPKSKERRREVPR